MTPEEVAAQQLLKDAPSTPDPADLMNNPNPDLTLATDPSTTENPMGLGAATAPGAEGAGDQPNAP